MIPMDMSPESVQKMMLLPKMLLSMHVLYLNVMDLRAFLRAEMEENILLEEEDSKEPADEDQEALDKEISLMIDEKAEDEELSFNAENNFSRVSEEKKNYLESLIRNKESLYEHLYWQLEVLAKDEEQKRIGDFLIGNLDANGYLRVSLHEAQDRLGVSLKSVKGALSLIRSFDPVGVGARNLKEALLIQLIYAGKGNSDLYKIVYSYLEDLEKGNYEKIAKVLLITVEEVEAAKKRIAYLNPMPAANFSTDIAVRVIPDVFAYKNNGGYDLEVNERDLPRFSISRFYKSVLMDKRAPIETKKYIRDKYYHAKWLIDAVEHRKDTMDRVCRYLIEAQKDFLDSGESAAAPLTLSQVADSLSISGATVSRAVSNKYIQMPDSVLALKKFFVSGVKQDSKMVSSLYIKQKIRELIDNEDREMPLKDNAIGELLKKEGIKISRRTIAKYRDNLKIPPFSMRKK